MTVCCDSRHGATLTLINRTRRASNWSELMLLLWRKRKLILFQSYHHPDRWNRTAQKTSKRMAPMATTRWRRSFTPVITKRSFNRGENVIITLIIPPQHMHTFPPLEHRFVDCLIYVLFLFLHLACPSPPPPPSLSVSVVYVVTRTPPLPSSSPVSSNGMSCVHFFFLALPTIFIRSMFFRT